MARALLLINHGSRSGQQEDTKVQEILAPLGIEIVRPHSDTPPTRYPEVIQTHQNDVDLVIVGGGDGSVKFAAEGAYRANLPLAIIPLGTANNVARSLGIPEDVGQACQVIAEGHKAPMDLATVNGIYFVSVAGVGLSSEVHKTVPSQMKKTLGPLAYAVKALQSFFSSKGFRVEIETSSDCYRTHALQVTICNGKYFGGHLQVREDSSLSDSRLDLLLIKSSNRLRGLWGAIRRKKGPSVRRISGRVLQIRTWPPMDIDVEGDLCTKTPARFEVIPGAIQIYTPRAQLASQGPDRPSPAVA